MSRILVIEDDHRARQAFVQCLELEGYLAWGVANGRIGLDYVSQVEPDLVICDIMMPELDGWQVVKALRHHPKTAWIPLIFLTAKVTREDRRLGMALGADDFITKPCSVEEFLAAITARLQRQALLKQTWQQTSKDPHISEPSEPDPTEIPVLAHLDDFVYPNCDLLKEVFQFIETHYAGSISLGDVAQSAGYSAPYLTTLLTKHTGRSAKDWVAERRMAEARYLLQSTTHPVKQIAHQVGYADPCYFVRSFRKRHGIPPQAWRKQKNHRA